MLRFLFLTDTHFRDDAPKGRTDDILASQWEELGEILNLVHERNIDVILHGGDFFNVKRPSHRLLVHMIDWSKMVPVPIMSAVGNHDISAYNLDTVENSGLGVLFESGAVDRLDESVWEDERLVIKAVHSELHFQSHYMIDNKYKDYTKIIVSHNYIIPQDNMPFEFVHPRDVKTNADLVLCGHYHVPFDYSNGKTRWINPGALSRWTISERDHTPQVLIVTVDKGQVNVEFVKLKSSKPGTEIFDVQAIENKKKHDYDIGQFVKSLEETSFDDIDLEKVVRDAGTKQNIDSNVLDVILKHIRKAEEVLK